MNHRNHFEFHEEAVKGLNTVGLRSKTHAVLITLKHTSNDPPANQQKILSMSSHVGISIAGLTDYAQLISKIISTECLKFHSTDEKPLSVPRLVAIVGGKIQERPFGVVLGVAGYDEQGAHLYQTCPSGSFFSCQAMTIGLMSQSARTYLQCHLDEFPDCTAEELIKHGLMALWETLPNDVTSRQRQNCVIGVVGNDTSFTIYENAGIEKFLKLLDELERSPGTARDDDSRKASATEKDLLHEDKPEHSLTKPADTSEPSSDVCDDRPITGMDVYVRNGMSSRRFIKGRIKDEIRKLELSWKTISHEDKQRFVRVADEENRKARSPIRKPRQCIYLPSLSTSSQGGEKLSSSEKTMTPSHPLNGFGMYLRKKSKNHTLTKAEVHSFKVKYDEKELWVKNVYECAADHEKKKRMGVAEHSISQPE